MSLDLQDGLYMVRHERFTAGFVVKDGKVTSCAPILARKLAYWSRYAVKIDEMDTSRQ